MHDQLARPSLSVVAPCYNEEPVIDAFYRALRAQLDALPGVHWRVILVDDGSSDGTLDCLNEIAAADGRVEVYSLSRNFGHQIALSAGLDHAAGDAVITMDCDLQHPPALIPQMVDLWQQGYDVVSTVRTRTADASLFKTVTAHGFYWLINHMGETRLVPGGSDFCLLSRKAHQALLRMPERHRCLRAMVSWIGFRRVLLPFEAPVRAAGRSKYSVSKMIGMAKDAIFSFSTLPIKVATRVGTLAVASAVAYMSYALWRHVFVGDTVSGWASLLCTILALGGLMLIYMGIMGEYIIRIFEESKGRPLYLLKQHPTVGVQRTSTPCANVVEHLDELLKR